MCRSLETIGTGHSNEEDRVMEDKGIMEVGFGVVILNHSRQILMAKRKGKIGRGLWALPGGKPKRYETIEQAARREVAEETGLSISTVTPLTFVDTKDNWGTGRLGLWVLADRFSGVVQNKEPDKHSMWQWFSIDKLPKPNWLTKQVVEMLKIHTHGWE